LSYVGGSGGPHSESVCFRVGQDGVDVLGPDGTGRRELATIFDYLERRLTEHRLGNPAPVPLNLGYVGWFGYELKALGPGDRRHESPYPDAFFVLADRMVIVNHESSTAWLGTLEDETTAGAVAAWTERAQRRLAQCRAPTPPDVDEAPPVPAHDARLRHDGRQYAQLVRQCQEFIRAGEAYEICLTNRLWVDADVDPLTVFRTLRAMSPAPFSAYLRTPYATVVGSSPERFLAVEGGVAVSRPMKGTRRRSADSAEDARLREDLRISVKDRAENLMITDLVRHDLGSVARPGTVTVDDLYRVESYPHVHQMVSQVSAELDDGRSVVDCIRAAFPAGSMTGAPKERVLAILDDLEGSARGIYSGALGFLTLDGRVDLSVVIRTLVVTPGLITIGVGGAVTALSDPDAEVAEMLLKAEPLLRSVGAVVATAECRG
jgi:para-aminobenzoate synthetase